jgi:hypothetical protein
LAAGAGPARAQRRTGSMNKQRPRSTTKSSTPGRRRGALRAHVRAPHRISVSEMPLTRDRLGTVTFTYAARYERRVRARKRWVSASLNCTTTRRSALCTTYATHAHTQAHKSSQIHDRALRVHPHSHTSNHAGRRTSARVQNHSPHTHPQAPTQPRRWQHTGATRGGHAVTGTHLRRRALRLTGVHKVNAVRAEQGLELALLQAAAGGMRQQPATRKKTRCRVRAKVCHIVRKGKETG